MGDPGPMMHEEKALDTGLSTPPPTEHPEAFWAEQARDLISWQRTFDTVHEGSFEEGDNAWFTGGQLNASFNCVDRWAKLKPHAPALIFEPNDPDDSSRRTISWKELQRQVAKAAWVLRSLGVGKGDAVAVYMPMIPEAFVAILACSRIGAIHSVVFAGFSSEALRSRIQDARASLVITADEGLRASKIIPLKSIADKAMEDCPTVKHCLVVQRTKATVSEHPRDRWWHKEIAKWPSVYAPEPMASEDPLFLLYTSGSTGKPKGLMHTTAGYLLGAALTTKHVFDVRPDKDIFFCGGDIGWITGHTYGLYGPLMLGCTTVVYEGTPTHPTPARYWEIIADHGVTQFYTAPTALRLLRSAGTHHANPDVSSQLRAIGSVGEPLAADVWHWVDNTIGHNKVPVVDTFFQTETGSHIIAPLAGVSRIKPGCCCTPFFGTEPTILDPLTGREIQEAGAEGVLVLKHPIPSMARSVWGDHERFLDVYYRPFPGYYFTGDAAVMDADGYFWIKGRVDDVINVAAHRLSTAEIESTLLCLHYLAEVAVVGVSDDLTGQAVTAFVSPKKGLEISATDVVSGVIEQVRKSIGAFAAPKHVVVVEDLPKTRSGKIMRRLLRKIWSGELEQLGDTSTLINPGAVDDIIKVVAAQQA